MDDTLLDAQRFVRAYATSVMSPPDVSHIIKKMQHRTPMMLQNITGDETLSHEARARLTQRQRVRDLTRVHPSLIGWVTSKVYVSGLNGCDLVTRRELRPRRKLGTLTYVNRYYGEEIFINAKFIISEYRARLETMPKHDTLVGTGVSGSIAAALLGHATGKFYAVIRKSNDASHSSNSFEGRIGTKWIFVDDFIASGETLNRVRRVMRIAAPEAEYVGDLLYRDGVRFVAHTGGTLQD